MDTSSRLYDRTANVQRHTIYQIMRSNKKKLHQRQSIKSIKGNTAVATLPNVRHSGKALPVSSKVQSQQGSMPQASLVQFNPQGSLILV